MNEMIIKAKQEKSKTENNIKKQQTLADKQRKNK